MGADRAAPSLTHCAAALPHSPLHPPGQLDCGHPPEERRCSAQGCTPETSAGWEGVYPTRSSGQA